VDIHEPHEEGDRGTESTTAGAEEAGITLYQNTHYYIYI
jgi:hypothetical protein